MYPDTPSWNLGVLLGEGTKGEGKESSPQTPIHISDVQICLVSV